MYCTVQYARRKRKGTHVRDGMLILPIGMSQPFCHWSLDNKWSTRDGRVARNKKGGVAHDTGLTQFLSGY